MGGGGSSPEAIICMSSSPERPAIVSRSALQVVPQYVRERSVTAPTLPPDRGGPACLADWPPAREARPARGRLRVARPADHPGHSETSCPRRWRSRIVRESNLDSSASDFGAKPRGRTTR